MPRPPLERRKSFWLGTLVLIFLAWASWQSFRKPYELYSCYTGTHHLSLTRMDGATYILQGAHGAPAGFGHGTIGNLPPNNLANYWRSNGIRLSRLPDAATAAIYVAVWIAWLAWLERKGRAKDVMPSAAEALPE